MSTLAIVGTSVGTLTVACLFDHFVTKIFSGKEKKGYTIYEYMEFLKKL